MNYESKIKNGFTVVELIVAMGIFVILMSVAAGGFINLLRNQRIIAALISVNDSMNLTLEQMAREIRTGYNFEKISDSELQFTNAYNFKIVYRLNNKAIEKGMEDFLTGEKIYRKLTADNVEVDKFNIGVCGQNLGGETLGNCGVGGDSYPPRITLGMSVSSAEPDVKKLNIFINIQTTVSVRQ